MPFDETIDQRIRALLEKWPNTETKKMFGGVCYLLNGHMVAGVYKDNLILRLGETKAREVLKLAHVKAFDITGRPMKGWVMVEPHGFGQLDQLRVWLDAARKFVGTLPAK